jgi:hypothetical protein
MVLQAILTTLIVAAPAGNEAPPAAGTVGHYAVLTCRVDTPPPIGFVDIICGPREDVGNTACVWWQLDIRANEDTNTAPLVQIRALTDRMPLVGGDVPLRFERYLVRFPQAGETLEYRNIHTGRALLPGWGEFQDHFVPRPARGSARQAGLPETGEYLGHVLTLRSASNNARWDTWADAKVLDLDAELLVGTGRAFKDKEGHRLSQSPKPQDYTYVPFTEDDYRVMFDAGINLFCVEPQFEQFVRTRPAFYIRGAGDGKTVLQYPADLYRSNYLGPVMFMDEPAILLIADKNTQGKLGSSSAAAAALERRVRAGYHSSDDYGRYALERPNSGKRINTGDMRLDQSDFPAWETLYETTYYQMRGGCNGIVHEGRYQLVEFDKAVTKFTHTDRKHTAEQLLKYHYAFLRGGTRPFDKYWGTAIYGQCDPAIAPRAVMLAYDMGARYIWYWTSDHDHHLPWVEQMELTRTLRKHAAEHPRKSIFGPKPVLDTAIVLPDGFIASMEGLPWVPVPGNDPTKGEPWRRYQRLMERLMTSVQTASDRNEDFDITVDDGREIAGYRKLVRITE